MHHQATVGAGVVLGSNVFDLAALLGLDAGRRGTTIDCAGEVVVLGGTVAWRSRRLPLECWRSALCGGGLLVVLAVLMPYVAPPRSPSRDPRAAQSAESMERMDHRRHCRGGERIRRGDPPARGTAGDVGMATGALVVVVVASVAMERGATSLGGHFGVAEIIVGGLVLAAVTGLPNAVSAIYLARRGRGAATLSTALNSNSLNVIAGLLIPAAVIGLAQPSGSGLLVAGWYVGLTALT